MKRICLFLALIACSKSADSGKDTTDPGPLLPVFKSADIVPAGETGTIELQEPAGAVLADINGDGIDDVVALARITSLRDDQQRVIALDGNGTALLWASPRLQRLPFDERPETARRTVRVGGGKVALAAGWKELQLFDAKSGAPDRNLLLPAIPSDICAVAPDVVSYTFIGTGPVAVDLASATLTDAHCPATTESVTTSGTDRTVVTRIDPATKKQLWRAEIAPHKAVGNDFVEAHPASYVDVSAAGVLVVIHRQQYLAIGPQRFVMLDPEKGTILWERDVSDPGPPHVIGKNLVVPIGLALELWDPATGQLRHTFGPAMGVIKGSALVPKN